MRMYEDKVDLMHFLTVVVLQRQLMSFWVLKGDISDDQSIEIHKQPSSRQVFLGCDKHAHLLVLDERSSVLQFKGCCSSRYG